MVNGFGPKIRRARLRKGISLRKTAGLCGISPAFLSDIERGNRTFSENTADKLSHVLGIKLEIPCCPTCKRPMPGYPQREWATTHPPTPDGDDR